MSDDPTSAEAFRWELEQEIERLKKTRDALTEERDELVRISNKLIRERDEARRQVCEWVAAAHQTKPQYVANDRKWDCFKEDTDGQKDT
jgi:uncharacterized coiled-coil DUF342 family protein